MTEPGQQNGMTGDLTGQVHAVVGASAGIGKATAVALAARGATVVMMARHADRLGMAAREAGNDAVAIVTDVADPASVRHAFDTVTRRFGRLDSLLNVAGVARLRLIEDASDEDIDYVMRINLHGPIYTSRAAIPLLRRSGGGTIVNVSSEVTQDAMPYNTLYGTSKAGLNAFSAMLNRELRESRIRVCLCIAGRTSGTAFSDNFSAAEWALERARAEAEGYYQRVAGSVPMAADEVADALVFMVTRPPTQMLDVLHVRSAQ